LGKENAKTTFQEVIKGETTPRKEDFALHILQHLFELRFDKFLSAEEIGYKFPFSNFQRRRQKT